MTKLESLHMNDNRMKTVPDVVRFHSSCAATLTTSRRARARDQPPARWRTALPTVPAREIAFLLAHNATSLLRGR